MSRSPALGEGAGLLRSGDAAFLQEGVHHLEDRALIGRGNCWDNAVAESFFATLEVELIEGADWHTRAEARRAIFEDGALPNAADRRPPCGRRVPRQARERTR
jgi:transposase InsO family protein